MKEQIKELRIQIDALAQLTFELRPFNEITDERGRGSNSKEICKAVDSLYLAKAWLGKVLGELKCERDINEGGDCEYCHDKGSCLNKNPYGSGYKTKEDIVPTQDVAKPGLGGEEFKIWFHKDFQQGKYYELNHIEKVDWLRTEIQNTVQKLTTTNWNVENGNIMELILDNVYTHLSEARFWLGFELGRIKEES